VVALLGFAEERWNWFFVNPTLPKADSTSDVSQFIKSLEKYLGPLSWSLSQIGGIMQLVTNHRHGTYAGSYAFTTYLFTACGVIDVFYYFPAIIGRHDANKGLPISAFVLYLVAAVNAWQAWKLPRVEQNPADVDEDEN
jgi:hypothetical protein